MTPDEIMKDRWLRILQKDIPEVDLEDVTALQNDPQAVRQFAAEYSQESYKFMSMNDNAIGDYVKKQMPGVFSYSDRERLIAIVQDLSKKKNYK